MVEAVPTLDSLHPIREPLAPDSLAPYLVMAAIGVIAAVLAFWALRSLVDRHHRIRRAAEAELALSRALRPPERLAAQAMLLRRLVRTIVGDEDARRQGVAWLERLDRVFATTFFTQSEGRIYGVGLYSPRSEPDVDALDRALSGFIAKVRR